MREEEVMVVRDLDQLLDLRLSKLDQGGEQERLLRYSSFYLAH